MSSNQKPNSELLLSVLEYLDRNGYKESFDNLLTDTGIRYLENIRRTIDDLLKQKKLDELIIYINTCDKLTNDEKNNFLKILKIRKFIQQVYKNCSEHLEQKNALQFLRTEITPIINNNELLNTLTKILFIKDIPTLKNFIQKNLAIYDDDKYILNQISETKIAPLEQIYNLYNQNLVKKYGINFAKYNVTTLKMNDLYKKENIGNNIIVDKNIKIMKISKNKKIVAFGLNDLNVAIFNVDKNKVNNSDVIDINLICNINIKENNNLDENNSHEISSINFSYDDKHILILINKFIINIYEISTGKLIHKYDELKDINNAQYISAKNDILLYSNNQLYLSSEIIKTVDLPIIYSPMPTKNDIQQILFSDFNNSIILIPNDIRDIECINLSEKKVEYTIEIKEDIFSANISQTDGGQYLIINLSQNYPKIFLYDLTKRQFGNKYYGHTQKNDKVICSFGGNKDQYILCGSEDLMIYLWNRDTSGLPRYQFKQHDKAIIGLGLINSSFILSCDESFIKLWTSYDIDDVNINKNKNNNNLMEEEK